MILETTRLRIVPLTVEQFALLLLGVEKMEKELKLNSSSEYLDIHTQQAMEGLYKKATKYPKNYPWYTNWQIILKADNKSIGSACFIGMPDEKCQVEIGYGINESYRNKGYATEAIVAMCKWALNQSEVKSVIAETEMDNYASHKVLEKCGMKQYKQSENSIWWRLLIKEEGLDRLFDSCPS